MERLDESQLERGRLDDEHVVSLLRRARERMTDVAAGRGVVAGGAQARRDEPGGRRLAVRPRHGQVGNAAQPGPQLELAPHRDAAVPRPGEDGRVLRNAGAGDDERRAFQVRRVVPADRDVDAELAQVLESASSASAGLDSLTSTSAPSATSASAAAAPATPAPITTTRRPANPPVIRDHLG